MNEAYRKMMMQQCLPEDADAVFYEKLENTNTHKPHKAVWKAAIAVTCVLLLIPVTVWAAESIFCMANIDYVGQVTVEDHSGIGINICFDDIKSHPVEDFSSDLQTLDGGKMVYYETWEEAEAHLGIDLLSNRICTDADTAYYNYFTEDTSSLQEHCAGMYRGIDDQLLSAKISAAYQRGKVKFLISAMITAEHPSATEAQLQEYHNSSYLYYEQYHPNITTEQFITQSGIPVTVCAVHTDGFTDYTAYFAVNDISYCVWMTGCEGGWDDAAVYAALREILEGFLLE